MSQSELANLLQEVKRELENLEVDVGSIEVSEGDANYIEGSIDTYTEGDGITLNTKANDTVTVSLEADDEATYSIKSSHDEIVWTEWLVIGPTTEIKDTYKTGSKYVRVEVKESSGVQSSADVVISSSG